MKFNLTKTKTGLIPSTQDDWDKLSKVEYGESFSCKTVDQRNINFHRKFFSLINLAFDNLPEQYDQYFKTPDQLRYELTKRAGFYEEYTDLKGVKQYKAKSIAFDTMSQSEFEQLYSAVIDVIMKWILPDLDKDILESELMNFL